MSAPQPGPDPRRWVICWLDSQGKTQRETQPLTGSDAHQRAAHLNSMHPGGSYWPERVYDESKARTEPPYVE